MLGQEEEGDPSPWDSVLLELGCAVTGESWWEGRCCVGCGVERAAEPKGHGWHWQDKMAVMVNRVKA